MKKFLFLSVVFMVLASLITGCGQQVSNTEVKLSQTELDQLLYTAQTQLEAGKFDEALATYEKAVDGAPSSAKANFGAGLLGALALIKDNNTRIIFSKAGVNLPVNLNELMTKPSSQAATANFANLSSFNRASGTSNVTIPEVQTYLKDTLIPAIDKALARLDKVEQDSSFTFIITKKMSGGTKNIEIDLGEVYALDSYLSLAKGLFQELISYDWNYVGTSNPFEDTNYPSFGKLKSDGQQNMGKARDAYARMFTKLVAGVEYIAAETDDQSDDGIPKFSKTEDKDSTLKYLNFFKASFENGPTVFNFKSGSTTVNFKGYYSSPVQDWHKYYVKSTNVNSPITAGDFSPNYDFTLNGLLPDLNSFSKWQDFARIFVL